ncbi:O-antigen ligase family protein [Lignipirellula cremea]|uniref:O-Antigen ligase n=1 Tax=Lignipirellula cremea TaxID=2528010 RepID=A0A518E588_9BACT|nr:O-antigen ligase family protein [Lignipirellula cremea]QDU99243.1 O-Antigen ligase [Lignipirellula cremea]
MSALIAIFAVAAVVWGIIFTLRGSLLAGCVIYMVTASCFGPNFLTIEAGITLSLDRIFFVALVGVYLVQWRLGMLDPKPLTKIDGILFAFIGWLTISTFTHDWHVEGPGSTPIVQHLLNGYLIPLGVFWMARQARHTEQTVTLILAGMTAFGAYLALTGVFESLGMWSLVYPTYIRNPELGLHFGRARGPMIQSVSYGVYLGTCLLCVYLLRERMKNYGWAMAAMMGPLLAAAIFLTKTRSVWLGAATGLLIVLCLSLKGRLRIAVLGTAIAGGLVVGVMKMDAIMGLQREGTVEDTHKSTSMRGSFTYVSWKMFLDRPLLGFGFGHFVTSKLPYLGDRSVDMRLEDIRDYSHHSTFLAVLTETGLIGFALFLALLGGWAHAAWRIIRHDRAPPWVQRQGLLMLGVLGVVFWQMIGHEITFTPLDQSLIYCVAGVAVGLDAKARAKEREKATAAWRPPAGAELAR